MCTACLVNPSAELLSPWRRLLACQMSIPVTSYLAACVFSGAALDLCDEPPTHLQLIPVSSTASTDERQQLIAPFETAAGLQVAVHFASPQTAVEQPQPVKMKRPPGRPRKHPAQPSKRLKGDQTSRHPGAQETSSPVPGFLELTPCSRCHCDPLRST